MTRARKNDRVQIKLKEGEIIMDEKQIEKPKQVENMEAKYLINALNEKGPVAACRELMRIRDREWYDAYEDESTALEQFAKYALEKHYSNLLHECVNRFQDLIKNAQNKRELQITTHSVSHFFGWLFESGYSEVAEKLVEVSASRAVELNEIECVDRMLGDMARYNLDRVCEEDDKEKFAEKYPFKPAVLTEHSEELINLLDPYYKAAHIFLSTETPKDFVIEHIKKKARLIDRSWIRDLRSISRLVKILELVKDDISEDEIKSYLSDVYEIKVKRIEDLKELQENIKIAEIAEKGKGKKEALEGIFVDVEGTLIINGELNEKLVDDLKAEAREGKKIVIFSNGPLEELSRTLAKMGVPQEFLPVVNKSDFKGKYLKKVIDDTHPEHQGFSAWDYQGI
ncbi:hypothetical protein MYX07_04475 [Patescibacteria group bacterium AH-259-L07]|nr:hypothetical protein [Patescibacteria group bacterium AH-259-L07]